MTTEETRKAAYRVVQHAIVNWLVDYAEGAFESVDPMVLTEVERIRDAMAAAGAIPSATTAVSQSETEGEG